jgi:hypothetical protein
MKAHSSDQEIADIIFKMINGEPLNSTNAEVLDKWVAKSPYNKSLLNDISNDEYLKRKLLKVFDDDRTQFWNIVINYRTAMHSDIKRKRNFWQRIFGLK